MSAKKPDFYGKLIILTNGLDEETGFLGSECLSPAIDEKVMKKLQVFCFTSD
jgi:hypothetical protein